MQKYSEIYVKLFQNICKVNKVLFNYNFNKYKNLLYTIPYMSNIENNSIATREPRISITIEIIKIIRNQLTLGLSIKSISITKNISARAVAYIVDKKQLRLPDTKIVKKSRKVKSNLVLKNQIISIVKLNNFLT